MNNVRLEWVTRIKYLGLIIDRKLKFNFHIESLCKMLGKINGAIYSLSNLVPQSVLIKLYFSLAQSLICQHIVIWGAIPCTSLYPLIIKINDILRNILGVKKINNVPTLATSLMYKELGIFKLEDLYRLHILKFIHKVFYFNIEMFNKYFCHLVIDSGRSVRRVRMRLPECRLEMHRQSTVFKACELYNNLPEDLIIPMSPYLLKKKFKNLVFSQY